MSVGLESSGLNLIKRAIELDNAKRYTESLICYQEGLQLLLQVCKGLLLIYTTTALGWIVPVVRALG